MDGTVRVAHDVLSVSELLKDLPVAVCRLGAQA
jgi:hypothetical protein